MKYKALPLIYLVNEHFKNTLRFAIEMKDEIDLDALRYAVDQVQIRYPYFSVQVETEGEDYVLVDNARPFVIAEGEKPLCLCSAEANYHVMSFSVSGHTVYTDIVHFICDGNGFIPVAKTLAYYYIERRYGTDGIDTATINLVSDPVAEEEYAYPYPDAPLPTEGGTPPTPPVNDPFVFDDSFFDSEGAYAYNLLIPQRELMACARANGGSPVSLISSLLYRGMAVLFPDSEKDIVFLIPHQYRKALGRPLSHDSLTRVFPVQLGRDMRDKSLEELNASLREQIRRGSDMAADIAAINGTLQLHAYFKTLSLAQKKAVMPGLAAKALLGHTFGVSYTGNIPWGGLEQYIRDAHGYAGENKRSGTLSIEVFTVGDYFSLCVMQPGKNPALVDTFMQQLAGEGVSCRIASEGRYEMPDCEI